jgi:hypothetical protein
VIHLYWHADPPNAVAERVTQWRAVMAGQDVRLWTPELLPELHERIGDGAGRVEPLDHPRHAANVVRWWALAGYGGLWVDADVTPRRPLPASWLESPFTAALGGVPTPFVCGGPMGHPLWGRALRASLEGSGSSTEASGGRMLMRVAGGAELRIMPGSWFAATDGHGRNLGAPPGGRYSDHAWATSSRRRQSERNTL